MSERVGTAGILVEGLTKRYRDRRPLAVDQLSFAVAPSEIYGLLGRNGSGKSTTVGMLATLLAPTSGTARVAGYDVLRQPTAVRRRIGVTLQETGVDLAATGRQLLTRHGRLLGLPAGQAAARTAELLDGFELAEAADRRLRTYSGGMRRRLDLALALVGQPVVVFLDEPSTGLDPLSRQALWGQVERLRDQGTTILLTTQYLEEADRLADRVGILADGRLHVEGSPDELKRGIGGDLLTIQVNPAQERAAAAVLDGRPEGGGRVRLQVRDGGAAVPRVVAALDRHGIASQAVALTQPTLDDVFLQVAGEHFTTTDSQLKETA